MANRIYLYISFAVFISFILLSCSNNRDINPIVPASGDDDSQARYLEVRPVEDLFWNTSVNVDGENWIAHMDDYGRVIRALGKGVTAPGPIEFVYTHFELFGISSKELIEKHDGIHDGMRVAIYRQCFEGIEIENSLIRLIYGRGGSLVSYGADTWSGYTPSGNWLLDTQAAIDIAQTWDDSKFIGYTQYYFAKDGGLIPAWQIDFDNTAFLVSAIDGEILETHANRYEWNHDGHISGEVKPWSPLDENIVVDMYGTKVDFYSYDQYYSGGTYADLNGNYEFQHGKKWRVMNLKFSNPWIKVQQAWESGRTTFDYWAWHDAEVFNETHIDDSLAWSAERNVLYYATDAHDWFWTVEPNFDLMNFQLPAFVDKLEGCTAYAYVGGNPSIHFFQPYDGCTNTGESPTIIQHEYGHIYVSKIYVDPSGSLHEACADTLANCITQHYMVGPDLYGPDTYRRVSNNERKWPAPECDGEVHCVGNVLAGAFWNLREHIGNELTDHHWHFSNYLNTVWFPEKAADVMLVDDDDDDITNGCPNYDAIYDAFYVKHNLDVPNVTNPQTEGVVIDVVPINLPHYIPFSDGGSFACHLRIQNLDDVLNTTQIWAAFEMPDSSIYGPLRPPSWVIALPYTIHLAPEQVVELDITQSVPTHVPVDTYYFHVRVGEYVDHINDVLSDEGVLEVNVIY